jgi:hypothetical protein
VLDRDQAAFLQPAQELPHDAAADAEPVDQVDLLGQHPTWWRIALDDLLDQRAHRLAMQARHAIT